MSDRLYAILNFTGVAVGDSATLPHGINVSAKPVLPDRVDLQFPNSFQYVSGDDTNITIRNVSSSSGACLVWVYAIHPVARSFGLSPDDGTFGQGLVPRPFSQGGDIPAPPFPPSPPVEVRIFARTTGSDTTGNGTQASPYRTFQRAILDPPDPLLPGYEWTIDCTGIGVEEFPVGYQMRSFGASAQNVRFGDPATVPFLFTGALNVQATPQPASNIPLNQTTVPGTDIVSIVDTAFGLATVTTGTSRAGWAANALKGKMCIGSGTDASTSCAIYGSDATHLFLCNTAAAVTSGPQQDLHIVEPSATFHSAGAGADGGGFECMDAASITFHGIKFTCDGGGQGLQIGKANQPFIELCDVDGLSGYGIAQQFGVFSSVLRNLFDPEGSSISARRSLFLGCSFNYICGGAQTFRQTVFDTCDSVGPSGFATDGGAMAAQAWDLLDCLLTASSGASGAILARGGWWSLQTVQINGSTGDALNVQGVGTFMVLNNVTGTTNAGVGVHTQDGSSVHVTDDATLVTGTGGDLKCGTLPVRTWTNFRTLAPTKNQFDIRSPFILNVASGLNTPAGDDVTGDGTGGCSGSRIFQR